MADVEQVARQRRSGEGSRTPLGGGRPTGRGVVVYTCTSSVFRDGESIPVYLVPAMCCIVPPSVPAQRIVPEPARRDDFCKLCVSSSFVSSVTLEH